MCRCSVREVSLLFYRTLENIFGKDPTSDSKDLFQVNLVLPITNFALTMFSQARLVDQMLVTYVGDKGHVLLKEDALDRSRRLGHHVGKAMGMPIDEVKYVGEEEEICPLCHSNLLHV